jgi:hypothetical protein
MKIKMMLGGLLLLSGVAAQKPTAFNLAGMLQSNQLETTAFSETKPLKGSKPGALSSVHPVLFKELSFTEGTIDIDLRGKNEFLKSFPGIIFHAEDTVHFDVLLFRPFNFRHADTTRHYWSVAYVSMPDYPWMRLRKEHPLVYENKLDPAPDPDDWFHATIVLKGTDLAVYLNHASKPCLQVQLLNGKRAGKLGLFSDGLKSDFANLVITPLPDDQKTVHINLTEALENKKLSLDFHHQLIKYQDSMHSAVGLASSAWMAMVAGINFQSGTIEADLRGRDLFQQSFLGVAFHIKDDAACEVVYFRPFNFNTTDSIRHHHAVQYMQIPEYPWPRLRKEKPEQYESNVIDPPLADKWFHIKLVVDGEWITAYVNYSCTASLRVKSLWDNREGKIALWSDGPYDLFSDLYINKSNAR